MNKVLIEKQEGICVITFNRIESYNAFDLETLEILVSTLRNIRLDEQIYGILITGNGKAFCTGGDLRWVSSQSDGIELALYNLAAFFHQAIYEIKKMPKPVVAAINGVTSGGGFALALACDFRFMERSALLKQGYTSNGLSIDGGLSFTLPRIVGIQRAMEILALDPKIGADQALSWGLVNYVVEDGESKKEALEFLKTFKERSVDSFAASKELLHQSFLLPFEVVLERERELLSRCGGSPNGQEGIKAFLEKRPAKYNRDKGFMGKAD